MNVWVYIIWIVAAYLCGSIPFGLLIGKAHGKDIRKYGSGNVGATNCARVVGRTWGLICFVADVLKGAAPVLGAGWYFGWVAAPGLAGWQVWAWLGVAAAPVVGHVFPIWLKFRGGKGVATGFGVVLGMWPYLTLPALAALVTWLLFAATLRYVSVASAVAAVSLPIWLSLAGQVRGWTMSMLGPLLGVTGLMAVVVLVRHVSNFRRIAQGTEARLGRGRSAQRPNSP
jgi:glycerol-3-phosphate acyltransferase PlsY